VAGYPSRTNSRSAASRICARVAAACWRRLGDSYLRVGLTGFAISVSYLDIHYPILVVKLAN
jgi:hypothetical protein